MSKTFGKKVFRENAILIVKFSEYKENNNKENR
jgi:hypothetical protein